MLMTERWLPLLLSLCALAACVVPALADEAIARPQVRVGDAWSYRQTSLITQRAAEFSYSVVEAGDTRIKTMSDGYGETYTPDWNLIESSAGMKIAPHEGYFSFPLEPGKTWPFKFERTVAKMRTAWEGVARVIGWEDIEVPAGSFRALRVDIGGSFGSGPVARRSQLQLSYWWSATVNRWVRQDIWMSRPGGKVTDFNTRTELIRYTQAQ